MQTEWLNTTEAAGDDRIRFLGHVQRSTLAELYSNAGVYVQASEVEGMSISLLDAMGYGHCCIASNIDENMDVLGDAGIAFRNSDIDDLALKMHCVVQSGPAVGAIGQQAKERIESNYSWDAVTIQLENLYREAISSRSNPRLRSAKTALIDKGSGAA